MTVPFTVASDILESYTIEALAPEGWEVDLSGQSLSIRPAAGLQSGSSTVRLTIRSLSDAARVMSELITVNIMPATPTVNFDVGFDPILTVSYRGAELPTAFRATTQNFFPSSQPVTFSYSNVTPGWEIISSRDGYEIPSGESSVHGIYLRPSNGNVPSPGSTVSFTVTAHPIGTVMTPISRTVSVNIGNIESIQFEAEPVELTTIPGTAVDGSLRLTNSGNVSSTVSLTHTLLPSGYAITSIPPSVTLTAGESITVPYTITPSASTPLNSYEYIRFQTDGVTEFSDRVTVARIRVVAPGAQSIASAAISAAQLGKSDLAEHLENVGSALTAFVQTPADAIARSQTISSLDAVVQVFQADPTLTIYASLLTQARNDLAAATTSDQILDSLLTLESVMTSYSQQLQDELLHGFKIGRASCRERV